MRCKSEQKQILDTKNVNRKGKEVQMKKKR